MLAVECRDVWMIYKNFMEKGFVALSGVDVEIEEGELYGILGPNGAGKTTLISIMSTILVPTKGDVKVLGMDAFNETKKVRERINIASGIRLPWGMRVYECLKFYALCYGISDRRVIEKLLQDFELEKYRNVRFDELSAGNKQKLNLARAFINNPKVVFLDEPTANLDPDVAKRIREIILNIKKEKDVTIVLTTHNMKEAEMLCDRIAFMKNGKIVAEGSAEFLKRFVKSKEKIFVTLKNNDKKALKLSHPYEIKDNKVVVYVESAEKSLAEVLFSIKSAGLEIESVKTEEITLEDVFVELAKSRQ
ncbi:MAG: ABC transporter ATP-binding protein [Archaeoglobaceae archaeon]